MPVTKVPSLHVTRAASTGRVVSGNGELVLKNLAEQLLDEDELWVFKQTLHHFRVTRSVPSLCTSLRPLITSTERLMLLVELAQHLPTEPLRRDFQKLCTLQFPKYHTFLRYFTPQPVTDGSKVIAQDASGQYLVANKVFDKKAYKAAQNGTMTPEPRHDATSVHGAESGFYSEHDDVSRHGNGRGSVSSRTSPPESAPSTLHRPHRLSLPHTPQSLSQRAPTNAKRQSLGMLGSGPLKILSGSFQSLATKNQRRMSIERLEAQDSARSVLRQKRILLARRNDGSLGVGIKGGKEYCTPIVVYIVEEGCQAEQQGLKIGDRIIDVNGTDFTNLTHAEAVTMMRNAWNIIMTVETDSIQDILGRQESNGGPSEEGTPTTELEILVYPSTAGKLGCAVNRDTDTGDIMVKSVERNSAAGKAGLCKGDVILEIDGMVVNALTEKQIATLTNSKRVRLRLRRKVNFDRTSESSASHNRSRRDNVMSDSDETFSPLDFSSPAPMADDDMFIFAASTPRNPGRSRSEDRILSSPSQPYSIPIHPENLSRTDTSPDIPSQGSDTVARIYRPRTMAVPASHGQRQSNTLRNGGGGGGPTYNTMTRGRSLVRQPPPQHPRYTIVYSVRGRSADTIVHPEMRPPSAGGHVSTNSSHSRNSKMRYIRHRSRSRDSTVQRAAISPADRDLLLAVQAGVEKRQRAVRLSMYQAQDDDKEDWKI